MDYNGDERKASTSAWEAVRNAGFYQTNDGVWTRKNETDASWYKWNSYWKHIKYANPYNIDSMESLGLVKVGGSDLVGYQARVLFAVPGKSLNGRVYLPETLRQAARPYVGKPFILDHDIEHAERVVGQISQTSYGVQEGFDGQAKEGLWGTVIGMMTREMFDRLHGRGPIPPMIRGVSIGGQGDGQYNADGGVLIKNFQPAELSITAFPGIPEAHIAQIGMIQESVRKAKLPKVYPRWEDVHGSNMETQVAKVNIREIGNGPGQTNTPVVGSSPRPSLRGLAAANDSDPRINIGGQHQVPQPTYGMDGKQVNPYNTPSGSAPFQSTGAAMYGNLKGQSSTEGKATGSDYGTKSSRDATAWTPKTPSLGNTTTQTPGFGGMTPSGTGITDQDEAAEKQRVQKVVASLQNDLNRVLDGMRTGRMPTEAKVDISKPEEEAGEEEEKAGKEEEEETEEERLLKRHLIRMERTRLARELDYNLGDQRQPIYQPTGDTMMSNFQRTINPGPDVTNSPPNEGQGQGEGITHVSSGRPASAMGTRQEFTAANPVRSGGEEEEKKEEEEERQALFDRLVQIRLARLEATGQTMPKSSTSVSKNYPSLGNTTTKTPGFGKLSPSGTGIKGQAEGEEEETVMLNGVLYRREQGTSPALDKSDEKPSGEEEGTRGPGLRNEEEDSMNPLAKAAGANVPQEMAPDIVPIEGSAPSLSLGIGQTLWHQYIRRNTQPSEEKLRQMMEGWNSLRQPKPQPLPQVKLRNGKLAESAPAPQRGNPSQIPSLPGVPARGVMSGSSTLNPQNYQTAFKADTRAVQNWGREKLLELDKRPYQQRPFDNYNSAHALFQQYLAEHVS